MAKITLQEETSTPATPPASNQSFFFKADGLYAINAAGQVTGPFASSSGFISGSYTLLDGRYQSSGTISTSGFITGSYTLLDGRYQPSGTYITGSYTLLDGRYQPSGSYITGSYTLLNGKYQPSGTYITGSYTLLDGMYLNSGTVNPSILTGTFNIQFLMGNGSSVVPTGSVVGGYHYVEVPYASAIESWNVYADATGSITINVLKSTAAGFPPTSSLAGLGQPKLTNQRKNNGTPTGTITLAALDVLLVEVVSAATVKIADLSLRGRKL